MEPESPNNNEIKPEGFENWSLEKKQAFFNGEQTPVSESLQSDVKDKAKRWCGTLDRAGRIGLLGIMMALQTGEGINNEKSAEMKERLTKKLFNVNSKIFAELARENPGLDFSFNPNKLPPRKGFEPVPKSEQPAEKIESVSTPEITIAPKAPEPIIPPIPVAEKMFDEKDLIHEVKAGDSTWKILQETLDKNEHFKVLTPAQKTYVLSSLTNKALKDPEIYGLSKNGAIHVGDKTNFTDLFKETKKVDSLFNEAKETVAVGGPQEHSILLNNTKIKTWVEANPHEEPDIEKILSGKKVEAPEPIPEPAPKPVLKVLGEENSGGPVVVHEAIEKVEPIPAPISTRLDENQLHQEIVEAKQRITELENARRNPNLERTLASDSRSYVSDIKFNQNVEMAFKSEINSIYSKRGLLGIGKTAGINTKEWGEMAKLPANKVLEYYTHDANKSGLAADIVEKLSKSKSHNALMKQTVGLMEKTNGAIKPFEKENMEQFIKRLGSFIMKNNERRI